MRMSARDWRTIGGNAPAVGQDLPAWALWLVPPLLAPLAAMMWMAIRWDRIPLRYATHSGPGNRPDGWTTRTPLHVFGMPIFAEGLLVLLAVVMLWTWYCSQRPRTSSPVEKILLAVLYLLSLVFTLAGVLPVAGLPEWPLMVVLPLAAIALIVYVARQNSAPDDTVDDTPNECWSLGGIYYNPRDPALFVRARFGAGYTVNMANRRAYAFIIGLPCGIGVLIAFLLWSQR